ncbi:diguanylate cyclase [Cryobacterium sp. GrIS_2_6]|uniref:diguanylate cyclase n=1 Tax=Cryobacterium sp. GrIS_2_6 TaxID=3162785 RepID=UPI002E00F23B|nr:diguanylate cyclase [Cryobacterium psychrotolerans]MEC5150060.1 diguanylate cyclase (GGDEF)-like protein [Cryobacterium psychrotolerans]
MIDPGAEPPTVLITDDSLVIRAVVRSYLEAEGYRVVEAVDGSAALEYCQQSPPDVILLDIEMPGLDGYEVLAELKADPLLRDLPVVFLTTLTDMQDVLRGLRGGAHDYLKKPFEPAELVARVAAAAHVKKLQDQLRQRNAELDLLSRTDALTGLHNRRHLEEELARLQSDAVRHDDPLCVLLLDIDHFKRVNDGHGHPAGDAVLSGFAERLRGELREEDVAGRWGGEEFLVVLPRTDLDGALIVANRIRMAVEIRPFLVAGVEIPVTVSGGCALGPVGNVDGLIRLADEGLYAAKEDGRNRIQVAALSRP